MIYFLLSKFGEPIYSVLIYIGNKLLLLKNREKCTQYGPLNPEKYFYVISNLAGGAASQYDAVLGYIRRANKKGYIPIVDLNNSSNDCLRDNGQKENNPWEYYWEQPYDYRSQKRYTLDEVYKSKNVIHNTGLHMIYKRVNKKNVNKRFETSKIIPFKKAHQLFFENLYENLLGACKGGVIGAYYRGTDYKTVGDWHPSGHAKVPEIEQYCNVIEEDMKKWKCKEVFFVTEEQEALEYFLTRFPEAKYIVKERFSNFAYGRTIAEQVPGNTTRYQNNLLYLADIYMLSRCNYLIGTINSGMLMAMNLNNNKYEDVHVLKLGTTR